MTTRNRSQSVPVTLESSCVYTWPDGSPYFTQGSPTTVYRSETMVDELSEGYFAKERRGQFLPINYMSQTKSGISLAQYGQISATRFNGTTPYVNMDYKAPPGLWGHILAHGATWNPAFKGTSATLPSSGPVLTEALANARSKGFDILTFMVEFRKTMDLIARFRDRTLKRAEKIANSIPKGASDPLAEFSATWLEGRYGWRILAYDLEAIDEAIRKLNASRPPFVRGYATESNESTWTTSSYESLQFFGRQTPSWSNFSFRPYGSCTPVQTQTATVRAGVVLEALLDDIFEIDPLVTAWEVIPFSFIVDWFVNVQELVNAYSPFASENLLGAWVKESHETISRTTINVQSGGTSQPIVVNSGGGTYIFETQSLTSVRDLASPSASLSFRLNIDSLKLIDLASIFFARWGKILGGLLKSTRI